jgi:hypothetical protein
VEQTRSSAGVRSLSGLIKIVQETLRAECEEKTEPVYASRIKSSLSSFYLCESQVLLVNKLRRKQEKNNCPSQNTAGDLVDLKGQGVDLYEGAFIAS